MSYTIRSISLIFFLLGLFLLLSLFFDSSLLKEFDTLGGNWIQSFRSDNATILMKAVTQLGSATVIGSLLMAISSYLLFTNQKRRAIILISGTSLSGVLSLLLKELVHRPRPLIPHLSHATGASFPSAHTALTTVFYCLVMHCVLSGVNNKNQSKLLPLVCLFILMPVGISRVYLGVHYPTDVLAGYLLGFLILTLVHYSTKTPESP